MSARRSRWSRSFCASNAARPPVRRRCWTPAMARPRPVPTVTTTRTRSVPAGQANASWECQSTWRSPGPLATASTVPATATANGACSRPRRTSTVASAAIGQHSAAMNSAESQAEVAGPGAGARAEPARWAAPVSAAAMSAAAAGRCHSVRQPSAATAAVTSTRPVTHSHVRGGSTCARVPAITAGSPPIRSGSRQVPVPVEVLRSNQAMPPPVPAAIHRGPAAGPDPAPGRSLAASRGLSAATVLRWLRRTPSAEIRRNGSPRYPSTSTGPDAVAARRTRTHCPPTPTWTFTGAGTDVTATR